MDDRRMGGKKVKWAQLISSEIVLGNAGTPGTSWHHSILGVKHSVSTRELPCSSREPQGNFSA